ncbi:MAG TPA: hypothetical protein PK228_02865, partial [Saprospiraceae bacterium]|nr:hypothetical protein [Saprospiraceae bacterium]
MIRSNSPFLIALLLLVLQTACKVAPPPTEPDISRSMGDYGGPSLTESLFDYKERTLSEEDIRRILDGKMVLRDTVRLAVFNFGGSMARYGSWRWYDEESLKSQQQLLDTLSYALTRSHRVKKVIF